MSHHSVQAEQAILGALMMDNRVWDRISGSLKVDDFYRHDHRLIYGVLAGFLDKGIPADQLIVLDALRASNQADDAGGIEYLTAIVESCPSSANASKYVEIIKEQRVRRDLAALGHDIAALADEPGETSSLIEQATGKAMAIADQREAGDEPKEIGSLLLGVLNDLERRSESKGGVTGLSTGFADLDEATCGLHPGDLVLIAGRPSMGKTTIAFNIGENAASGGEKVIAAFSFEMGAGQVAERMIASHGAIDTQRLRRGNLLEDDWSALTHAVKTIEDQKIIIADDPGLATPGKVRMRARKIKQKYGRLDLIIIDYLQLMSGDGFNRNEEISGITRSLKLLAREMNCPLIALSQLSRKVEERTDKRPILSDLRESGAIEQDADVVIMMYRDEYYNPDSPMKGFAEAIIRKQRMGPLGDVPLVFEGQYSRFRNADKASVIAARNQAASSPKVRYSGLRD